MKLTIYMMKFTVLTFIISFLSSCMHSEIKSEMKESLRHPFSARGSSIKDYTCGFPVMNEFEVESIDISLDSEGYTSGSGSAKIHLKGKSFECRGEFSFTYFRGSGGGHSSMGSFLTFGSFERISKAGEEIFQPYNAKQVKFNEVIEGELSEKSPRLPDGSSAHFFYFDNDSSEEAVEIDLRSFSGSMNGACYKNGIYQTRPFFTKSRYKTGRMYLVLNSGDDKGKYRFTVRKHSKKESSVLMEPDL